MSAPDPKEDEAYTLIKPTRETMHAGEIAADEAKAAGVDPGPIELRYGFFSKRSFGLRHIEFTPGRVQDIQRRGYADAKAYCFDVAANWTKLYLVEDGKLLIVHEKGGFALGLVLTRRDPNWGITTALPYARVNPKATLIYTR